MPRKKSKPAPEPRGKAAQPRPPVRPSATCPRPTSLGYSQFVGHNAEVMAIVKDGVGVPAAKAGDAVDVVLDKTSFYGDSGGQVGDTGRFTFARR